MHGQHIAIWLIAGLATAGLVVRPRGWPEAIWATLGAVALVAFSLISRDAAVAAIAKGLDVYLFLIGMMLLAEVAREQGLFDWLAALAAKMANGSAGRLFTLVYAVGVIVTIFLSNDATAVVLTPAVYAAARAANANPLPYLLICAFVANAASFVLPISNPANLVIYGGAMPPLETWLLHFTVPSVLAIAATYAVLRCTQRQELVNGIAKNASPVRISAATLLAAAGIVLTAAVLLAASAYGIDLGWPTFAAGTATMIAVALVEREAPWPVLRNVSWSVIPLVAGLFVLVAGLEATGFIASLSALLRETVGGSQGASAFIAGVIIGIGSNLINNLPAGLIAASASSGFDTEVRAALLIGVDLGPNLSLTGSLATILWLQALRREGVHISARDFFLLGVVVMPPALMLAIAALLLTWQ